MTLGKKRFERASITIVQNEHGANKVGSFFGSAGFVTMATFTSGGVNRLAAVRRCRIHNLLVVRAHRKSTASASTRGSGTCARSRFWREVLGEIIDDLGEFVLRGFGPAGNHGGDDFTPLFARHAPPENEVRAVTVTADLLNGLFAGGVGELRRSRGISRGLGVCS